MNAFKFVPANPQVPAVRKNEPIPETAAVVTETPLADALVKYRAAQAALAAAQEEMEAASQAIKDAVVECGYTYGEVLGKGKRAKHFLVTWQVEAGPQKVSAKKLRAYFEQYPRRGAYEDFLFAPDKETLQVVQVTAEEYEAFSAE